MAKRHYENVFRRHLQEAIGSAHETKLWLDFALECSYLTREEHSGLMEKYEEISKMLYALYERWHTQPRLEERDSLIGD